MEARPDLQHLALLRISGLAVRFVPGIMDSFVSNRVTSPPLSAPEIVPKLSVHRGGQNNCPEGGCSWIRTSPETQQDFEHPVLISVDPFRSFGL